jgi:hypothetical protein
MSEPVSTLPGTNRFGPFRAGQILERTADLIRESPTVFFGIGFLAVAAAAVAGMIFVGAEFLLRHFSPDGSPAARALALAPLALLCFGAAFVVAQIAQGAFFVAARQKLEGARPSVGEACSAAAQRLGTLAGIAILIALRIIGYLLVFYLVCAIVFIILIAALGGMRVLATFSPGHMANSGAILLLVLLGLTFFVLYLLFLIWLIARYSLSVPAAMEEGVPAGDAIRRSIALTHGAKGRIIALLVFAFGVNLALAVVTLPIQMLSMRSTGAPPHALSAAGIAVILAITLLRLLVGWVVSVFLGVGFVLCYFDLRVRKENFGGSAAALPPGSLAVVGGAMATPQAPAIHPLPLEPQATDLPQDDLPIS